MKQRIIFLDESKGDQNLFIKGSVRDRDNSTLPWVNLKESIENIGLFFLMFKDVTSFNNDDVFIEFNYTGFNTKPKSTVLVITEPQTVNYNNFKLDLLKDYNIIFSVFNYHSKLPNYNKIFYPVLSEFLLENNKLYFFNENRENKICFIGTNYVSNVPNSTYGLRSKLALSGWKLGILDLYGTYWSNILPPILSGNKIINHFRLIISKLFPLNIINSLYYKRKTPSKVESKNIVYSNYNYVLCIENTIINGYISEKIFDAMMCGCVPIYLGDPCIEEYIPENCFFNLNNVSDLNINKIDQIIKTINYDEYKKNIEFFLYSDQSHNFYIQNFSNKITQMISKFIK